MKGTAALIACLVLAGCSSTPQDLEAKTAPTIRSYTENYQEIYRRISSTAKRCEAGNTSAMTSQAVDSELYPDLGYGEISKSMINYGVRNYYWTAKIERDGKGAKMTLRSGNTINNDAGIERLTRWASGDQNC